MAISLLRCGAGISVVAGGCGTGGGGGGGAVCCGFRNKYQAMVAPPRIIKISFIVHFFRVGKLFYLAHLASAHVLLLFC